MEIRYITQNDNLLEISNIYENSWKYAYKNIIPQDYLDSIPTGQWVNSINKVGMNNLVIIEDGFICSEVFLEDNIGGKDLREVLYFIV